MDSKEKIQYALGIAIGATVLAVAITLFEAINCLS